MKTISRNLLLLAMACLVLVAWLMLSAREEKKLKPGSAVQTIQDFLQQMPPPTRVRRFSHSNATYYDVWGQLGGMLRFPSGPPSYIFDLTGRLVDWTYDRGEARDYEQKWGHFKDAQFVSVQEMLQALVGTNAGAVLLLPDRNAVAAKGTSKP
ncbi:MAG: hypothetical protein HZC54_04325 [Verrucomicrobia bacterium]|nr:hypothetical protein [Verrucomicrobiota bacterium]